ncbi:hypothetical protein [Mesorhizobium onobrychidis]|uniref:Uncharacterized protein n=1 Tax=Mesorhizobium onobrychidis TaxID=2775404 RepID=A0ABY5QRX1_9HYPH|nr:hypothetical protein [Mesorhizobium onobrychidis]UVC12837.1 hypothetical protein IHQ72_18875 [Mesorhizobium onobrychidis]
MNTRRAFDRAELLSHATFVRTLDQRAQDTLVDLITLAINRFLEGWEEFYSAENARLFRIQEHVDQALAALIVKAWRFHDDDDYRPFTDEAGAYAWLQGEGENPDAGDPGEYFARSNNWKMRSLWDVRQEIEAEILDLSSWDEARHDAHWTRAPETSSRLPTKLQEMTHDFCQAWHDIVDEKLGLPRRDPNPTNPLLRFIDYCLSIPLGDQRPAPKTILQLVHDHIRPAIHAEDEEDRMRAEKQQTSDRVDFDPFGPD